MPGDQKVIVQVSQNTPEPQLLMAQAVGGKEVQMLSVLQVFCESLCLGLANQTDQGVQGGLHSSTEGGWNLFGEIFTSLQRQVDLLAPLPQSPVLSPQTPHVQPGPKSSTQDITVLYLNLFHSQMTGKKCD